MKASHKAGSDSNSRSMAPASSASGGVGEARGRRRYGTAILGVAMVGSFAALAGAAIRRDAPAPAPGAPQASTQASNSKLPAVQNFAATPEQAEWQAFIDTNCATCHSERNRAGGLVLAGKALMPIGENADIWEKVVYKVTAGEMPPPAVKRRPDPHQRDSFVAWLSMGLSRYAAANPDAGRPVIRRLTRAEYNNAVRDLLHIDMSLSKDLPPDPVTIGFDNNGDALSVTPLMLEKYARAARLVTRAAIGDKSLLRTVYEIPAPDRQASWHEGVPVGARGGPVVRQFFPAAGNYTIRVIVGAVGHTPNEGQAVFTTQATLSAGNHKIAAMVPEESALAEGPIPDIDGPAGRRGGPLDPLGTATALPVLDVRVDDKLVKRFTVKGPSEDDLQAPNAVIVGAPFIRRIDIDGPVARAVSGETTSRARIFICQPASAGKEKGCAQKILSAVVRRAYRRDISSREVRPFLALYQEARKRGDFESAIQEALQAVLVSPTFLFRIEQDPKFARDANYRINDFDLATRLSFLLWSSIPDDRLLELARSQKLRDPAVLTKETMRMLADRRADALVENFGLQFLGLQELEAMEADKKVYPTFKNTLRDDFVQETRLFVRDIMRSNRSVVDLVGANYTFLNPDLARHYKVDGVLGYGFRRVEFKPDSPRGGVLGQGSILMATSHPNVSSPVLRGKWVLTSLFNQPPSPPPPGIPALVAVNKSGRKLTGREQMEQHRTSAVCSSCHARMDPFGFAMENFDVTGAWRTRDEAGPVNPAVSLTTGPSFSGVPGLRSYLVGRGDDLALAFTSRLMTYALGRRLKAADAAVARGIVARAKPDNYRFQTLVLEVVKSMPFQMRRKEEKQ